LSPENLKKTWVRKFLIRAIIFPVLVPRFTLGTKTSGRQRAKALSRSVWGSPRDIFYSVFTAKYFLTAASVCNLFVTLVMSYRYLKGWPEESVVPCLDKHLEDIIVKVYVSRSLSTSSRI
jgi:hypothetical protein